MDKIEIEKRKEEGMNVLEKIKNEAKILQERCNYIKNRLDSVNTEEELKQFCLDDRNDLEEGFEYIQIFA